jgi:hypothetical protein
MRTHFSGVLLEVRSAARFPFSVLDVWMDVWMPDEWRASANRGPAIASTGKQVHCSSQFF